MNRINYKQVKQVLIERVGEKIWMIHVGRRILVLVLSAAVNLGSLKMRLSSTLRLMAGE